MIALLIKWFVIAGVFMGAAKLLPEVKLKSLQGALTAAAVLGLANLLLGWLLSFGFKLLFFLPAILSFGLAYLLVPLLVNMSLLKLTDEIVEDDLEIEGPVALFKLSLAVSLSTAILGWFA